MMQKIVSAVASVALLSLISTGTAFASTYTVQHDDTKIAKNIQSSVPDLKNSEGDVPANIQPSSLSPIVIQEAKKVMGVPYVWGGTTENGFDCRVLFTMCLIRLASQQVVTRRLGFTTVHIPSINRSLATLSFL
jgi:hypothetical protein